MFTADVNLDGLRRIEHELKVQANRAIEKAVRRAGAHAVEIAKGGRFKDRTGFLRASIRFDTPAWRSGYFSGELRADRDYASHVEWGTKPHEIWPKAMHGFTGPLRQGQSRRGRHEGKGGPEFAKGLGLALRWEDGSGEHFARMVHHPGTEPLPFMRPAAEAAAEFLVAELRTGFVGLSRAA